MSDCGLAEVEGRGGGAVWDMGKVVGKTVGVRAEERDDWESWGLDTLTFVMQLPESPYN